MKEMETDKVSTHTQKVWVNAFSSLVVCDYASWDKNLCIYEPPRNRNITIIVTDAKVIHSFIRSLRCFALRTFLILKLFPNWKLFFSSS